MGLNSQILKLQDEIYEDLERPSKISPTYISTWLISNVGKLNNLIDGAYTGICNSGITPTLGQEESNIHKMLFMKFWYDREIKSNLGANGYIVESVKEGDSSINLAKKTEIAKNLQVLSKELKAEIDQQVHMYRNNNSKSREVSASEV